MMLNLKKNILIWNKGKLTRYTLNKKKINKIDYLYIHFQSRPMKINTNNFVCYKIIPNSFDNLEVKKITVENFPKWKHFNMHYFKLRSHNLIDKIKTRLINNEQ